MDLLGLDQVLAEAFQLRRDVGHVGGGGVNIADIPFRFINCFVAGLAYMLSVKIASDPQRVMGLKADYDQQFDLAAQEDREKAAIRFVPRNLFYAR